MLLFIETISFSIPKIYIRSHNWISALKWFRFLQIENLFQFQYDVTHISVDFCCQNLPKLSCNFLMLNFFGVTVVQKVISDEYIEIHKDSWLTLRSKLYLYVFDTQYPFQINSYAKTLFKIKHIYSIIYPKYTWVLSTWSTKIQRNTENILVQ